MMDIDKKAFSEVYDIIYHMDKGLYKEGYCGPSKFMLFDVKEYVDTFLEHLRAHPEEYYSNDILNWIINAKNTAKENLNGN